MLNQDAFAALIAVLRGYTTPVNILGFSYSFPAGDVGGSDGLVLFCSYQE